MAPHNDDAVVSSTPAAEAVPPREDFTTLNLSGESGATGSGEAEVYRQQMQSGARWFYWIAGLSLVNSIAALFDGNWSFLAGLGITQFISGFAGGLSEDVGGAATAIGFILDLLVAGFFVLLGVFAVKGEMWAFIIGLVVYALDTLIFLAFQLWLPLAFHVFVFYCLYRGLAANRKLKRLEAELASAT